MAWITKNRHRLTFQPYLNTAVGTGEGYKKLDRETLTVYREGAETERDVPRGEWHDTLAAEFGLRVEQTA